MEFWDRLGKFFSFMITLKAIPLLIVLIIIFVVWNGLIIQSDQSNKGENYVNQGDLNKVILDIANEHANQDIFYFKYNPSENTAYDSVHLSYTFLVDYKQIDAEQIAYNEILYVYNAIKDIKIKKDNILIPKGKRVDFSFYGSKNGKVQEIGFYSFSNLFGNEWDADDIYPVKTTTILGNY